MITHATVARYLSHNHKFKKFTREDLDFMKHVERAIQTGIRLRQTEGNITIAATSEMVVARGRKLLGMLGFTTETRDIGGQPYLIVRWEGDEDEGRTAKPVGDNQGATGSEAGTQGEGGDDPPTPSAA